MPVRWVSNLYLPLLTATTSIARLGMGSAGSTTQGELSHPFSTMISVCHTPSEGVSLKAGLCEITQMRAWLWVGYVCHLLAQIEIQVGRRLQLYENCVLALSAVEN